MTDVTRAASVAPSHDADLHAISWQPVLAGAFAIAALTLVLLAFGSAVGFSSISPWSNSGVSASTFHVAAGIYLVVVAMLSSTVGGYIAGRLRTRWRLLKAYEVQFRDTAHGFLAWAVATVIGAALLGSAAAYLAGGAVQSAGAQSSTSSMLAPSSPVAYYVNMLLRPTGAGRVEAGASIIATREAETVFLHDMALKGEWPAADRAYLTQLVSQRTGLSGAAADKRVGETIAAAKAGTDKARKAAASLSIWLAISMFVGAFCASLAAIEGGQLRDEKWNGIIGARAYREQQSM